VHRQRRAGRWAAGPKPGRRPRGGGPEHHDRRLAPTCVSVIRSGAIVAPERRRTRSMARPSRAHALLLGPVAGQAGAAGEGGAEAPVASTEFSFGLAGFEADGPARADAAGAAGAGVLAGGAALSAEILHAGAVIAGGAEAAGAAAAAAGARLPQLAARDTGAVRAAACQREVVAALEVERADLAARGALGTAAALVRRVAVATAALLVRGAVRSTQEILEVLVAARLQPSVGAVLIGRPATLRPVAAAGITGAGERPAGALQRLAAGAAGAGGVPGATARPDRAGLAGLSADVRAADPAAALEPRAAIGVARAGGVLAEAAAATLAGNT